MSYRIVVKSRDSGLNRVIRNKLSKENADLDATRLRYLEKAGWSVTVEPESDPPLRQFRTANPDRPPDK